MTSEGIEPSQFNADDPVPDTSVVKRRTRNLCLVEVANTSGQLSDQFLVSLEQSTPFIRVVRENGALLVPPRVLDASGDLAKKILGAADVM